MTSPRSDATQQRSLRELSLRELCNLATPEAWLAALEDTPQPYIFAGKAETAAATLTRPAIMTALWPIHEPEQTEAAERTAFANAHFVVALVNAYRNGELVESRAPSATLRGTERPFGACLATAVLQSDLYRMLDAEARVECDELIERWKEWLRPTSTTTRGANG